MVMLKCAHPWHARYRSLSNPVAIVFCIAFGGAGIVIPRTNSLRGGSALTEGFTSRSRFLIAIRDPVHCDAIQQPLSSSNTDLESGLTYVHRLQQEAEFIEIGIW